MHQCFEEIQKIWERPFYQPVTINRTDGSMSSGKWAVGVYNLTASGNISKSDKGVLFINFCPICGENLEAETP